MDVSVFMLAMLGIIKNDHICEVSKRPMQFTKKRKVADKFTWMCRIPCRREYSIRKGSVLEFTKVPINVYFCFLLKWLRSHLQVYMAHNLNVNKNTISKRCSTIRECIQNSLIENREMLSGYDEEGKSIVVEID